VRNRQSCNGDMSHGTIYARVFIPDEAAKTVIKNLPNNYRAAVEAHYSVGVIFRGSLTDRPSRIRPSAVS